MDVFTNHQSLKYIINQKELNLRQRRWLELLKDDNINILYHPSKANISIDDLSKLSMESTAHIEDVKRDLAK